MKGLVCPDNELGFHFPDQCSSDSAAYSAHAAITKYHRLCDLNHRNLFLMVLEAEKSNVKVLSDPVPREGSRPGLQATTCSVCPHTVERRSSDLSLSLLVRTLIPSRASYTHDLI